MKSKLPVLLIISTVIFFTNCKSTKDIAIFQDKNKIPVKESSQIVNLDKNPFSFYFNIKKYTETSPTVAKLVAFSNKDDLDNLEIGLNISETKCFDKGDAIALKPISGYDALYIVDYGFHALYYDNPEDKSIEVIFEKDDFVNVAFHVNRFFINEQFITISDYKLSKIYIALFIDSNYNKKIDEGELTKFTVQFKD